MDRTATSTLREIRPTWVDIDLDAFDQNVASVAATLPPGSKIIAVLKADAYGHGAVELGRRCHPDHVAMIATALLEEAFELRHAGIDLPLLVLGPLGEEQVAMAIEHQITLGVPGPEELEIVARAARERDIAIHLKLDSGMGRMGVVETELPRVAEILRPAPRLRIEAFYTHFANASDPQDAFTTEQAARFETLVETLRQAGITAERRHIANSAAATRGLVREGDFVRAGITLLGAQPLDRAPSPPPGLQPLMRWRTEIARLKDLPEGHVVGYGKTFTTARPSRIATIPAGYADGYSRGLSNRGVVLVRGKRAPIAGRVSMDMTNIDVTDIPGVAVGDEVVLLGSQGSETITVEEIAKKLDTISYEVFCGVSARVPRVYHGDGAARVHSRFL
jgi:alanine racemase